MKRNYIIIVISIIISILLHAIVLSAQLSINTPNVEREVEQVFKLIDAVIVEKPEPVLPEPSEPTPVPKIEEVSEAVIEAEEEQPQEPEPRPPQQLKPQSTKDSGASTSVDPVIENFLPFYRVDKRPEFISKAELKYPLQAKRSQIEGTVILEVDIDSKGIVKKINIVKSAGFGFDEAAYTMIENSTFKPAETGSKPVAVRMRFTILFEL